MEKLDLTKKYKSSYSAKRKPEVLTLPPAQYLSVSGKGDPSGLGFSEDVGKLYSVAYAVKFICKARDKDFSVPKLEGLWWFDDSKYKGLSISEAPQRVPRSEWSYRLLLRMPDYVKQKDLDEGIKSKEKKGDAKLDVQLILLEEGKVVQMLHVGPFETEPETLQTIFAFCVENKFAQNGLHHEIYLSDFRKTPPEKLKTILREPVK